MTQQELVGVDISFEKDVIESGRGVRQRALAIQALVGVAERLDAQVAPELIERFRGLTKKEAALARKSLENLVQLFGEKPVKSEESGDTSSVEVPAVLEVVPEDTPTVELFVEDEPEEFTVPPRIEVQEREASENSELENDAKPLSASVQKWLSGLVSDDIATLTEADIPRIVDELMELRGRMTRAKLNYKLILTEHLKGQKQDVIAELVGSTHGSLSMSLANFKRRIVKIRSTDTPEAQDDKQEGDNTPKEPTQALKPVPRPPQNPTAIRPILVAEKPVPTEVAEPMPVPVHDKEVSVKDIREERLVRLIQATEEKNIYSQSEWLEIAEEHIRDVASGTMSAEQVDALWQHIHIDDEDQYKLAPAEYQQALEIMRPQFKEFTRKVSKDSYEARALRMLFNSSMGYKHLEDIHKYLSRSDVSRRINWTQRVVVAGIGMVLEQDV